MRILSITLTNLNSLKGTWEVNLEHPAYVHNGIFAICGPTGAGKSTLLDAISLALYQCTPRQGHIAGSGNEVMTRGAGNCASEVTFEAAGSRYLARWSQRRARNKAEGNLQSVRHELSKLDPADGTWKIISSRPNEIPRLIEKITGMGSDQFSRSMVLAQGNFAAFMKSSRAYRSQALEQITGTGIYSLISQRVQQTYALRAANLDKLKSLLAGMNVLTSEEAAQKAAQKIELERSLAQQREAEKTLGEAARWLEKKDELKRELTSLCLAQEESRKSLEALAPEKPVLEKAERAAALSEDYALLSQAREACKNLEVESKTHAALEPEIERALANARAAQQAALNEKTARSDALAALRATLKTVRGLDALLAGLAKECRQKEGSALDLQKESQTTSEAIAALQKNLAALRAKEQALAHRTSEDSPNARIFALRETLAEALTLSISGRRSVGDFEEKAAKAARELRKAVSDEKATLPALTAAREALTKESGALEALEEQSRTLLDGRTPEDLAKAQAAALDRQNAVERALDLHRDLRQTRERIAANEKTLAESERKAAAALEASKKSAALIRSFEENRKALQEKARLKTIIEQLAQERSRLHEGEPCPLCGALSHPYAEAAPDIDVDLALQDKLEQKIEEEKKTLFSKNSEEARARAQVQTLAPLLEKEKEQASEKQASIESALQALFDDEPLPQGEDIAPALKTLSEDAGKEAALLKHLVAQASSLSRLRREQDEKVRLAQASLQKAEQDQQLAGSKRGAAEAIERTAQDDLKKAREDFGATIASVSALLQKAGLAAAAPESLEAVQKKVRESVDAFEADGKAHREALAGIQSGEHELEGLLKRSQELSTKLASAQSDLAAAQSEYNAKLSERRSIFGEKSPDEEENKAQKDFDISSKKEEDAKAALAAAEKAQQAHAVKKAELARRQTAQNAERSRLEESFSKALKNSDFESESIWLSARMPADVLKERLAAHSQAQNKAARLSDNIKEKTQQLQEHAAKNLTQEDAQTIKTKKEAASAKIEELSQQIGAISEQLKADEDAKARQKQTLAKIEGALSDLEVWAQLNALIGSHDGKKYREFVQSITFETLIDFANESLVRMTDRYELTSSKEAPLEFDVIDNYQGGVVRSSSNLSGGETFIASLALALGLSRMASANVQVESLFLDEGFGTLDPEALDNTLGMLATLNEQGKLIGIISHVGEIRERIAARIEVTPVTGGFSRLSGPGVREIAASKSESQA